MDKTVLVADDDRDIVKLITESLKFEQFHAIPAYSGEEVLRIMKEKKIDFVVLDIMMPEMNGLEVCRNIRSEYNIPILLLSARDRDIDKIIGLEIGADDYMTKPFSIHELTSRIKAHFRKVDRLYKEWNALKQEKDTNTQAPSSPLVLNEKTFEVYVDNQKLELSAKEFLILSFLKNHPNHVLTRDQIYENVWGDEYGELNTVTVHIKNIRKKLGVKYDFIKTVWGVGYKYTEGNE
ncbi:response regulator transcription factor [Paenibacillus antri]|uniref:Response regulator transcription factor n=1 Tax=Paenibacillus antri TaxID=2582848 RepID=A0A5R9G9G8_9BACL|nr:response regulator transcription factor [Paenibacillus antri]TLS50028.1 response regulator transcription factor [Paenibacillus antri]